MRHPIPTTALVLAAALTLGLAGTGDAARGASFDAHSYFQAAVAGKVKVKLPGERVRREEMSLDFTGAADRWSARWSAGEFAGAAVRRGKRTLELGPTPAQDSLAESVADLYGFDLSKWEIRDVDFVAKINRRGTRVKLKGTIALDMGDGKRRAASRVRVRLKGRTTRVPAGPPSVRSPAGEVDSGSLVALPDGGAALVGELQGVATFGVADPNERTLTPPSESRATPRVIARYAPDGSLAWVREVRAGDGLDNAGVATLPRGELLFVADACERMTLSVGDADERTVSVADGVVIARYGPSGSLGPASVLLEVDSSDSNAHVNSLELRTLPDGSSYVAGRFSGDLTFHPGTANALTLVDGTGGNKPQFIAHFDADQRLVWVRRLQSDWFVQINNAMTVRADGGVRVCATFGGTLTIDRPESTPITATADPDVAQTSEVSFGRDGTYLSSHVLNNGGGNAAVSQSAEHPDGSFSVSGSGNRAGYVPEGLSPVIGPGSPNATELPNVRARWIARYEANGTLRWVRFTDESNSHRLTIAPAPGGGLHLVASVRYGEGVLSLSADDEVILADPLLTSQGEYALRAHYAADGELSGVRALSSGGEVSVWAADSRPDGTLVVGCFVESTDGPITFDLDGSGTTADVPQIDYSVALLRLDAE